MTFRPNRSRCSATTAVVNPVGVVRTPDDRSSQRRDRRVLGWSSRELRGAGLSTIPWAQPRCAPQRIADGGWTAIEQSEDECREAEQDGRCDTGYECC
jgi:hypothetical protein